MFYFSDLVLESVPPSAYIYYSYSELFKILKWDFLWKLLKAQSYMFDRVSNIPLRGADSIDIDIAHWCCCK